MALAVMIVASSTYNSFAKEVGTALSPLTLLVLSETLTAFFVILAFGFLPTMRSILRLDRKYMAPLIALGLLNGLIAPLLLFHGLSMTTAVNAELFARMEMVALLILAITILREEHLTRVHVIAGSVILLGIAFVALRGFSESLSLRPGDPLLLLSSFIFAGGSIIYKKYLQPMQAQVVIVCRACTAVVAFFLIAPFLDHPLIAELRAFPVALIPALLGFGFISRFLNLFSFYEAIERIPVSAFSMISTVNVIGGVAFAHLYLGEAVEWYHLIGGGLIILGALLLEILGIHPSDVAAEEHLKQHHRHHL